jgi:GTP pyrophosphokinase
VVDLVLEVTRKRNEEKTDYLKRIFETGSRNAKILKVADRIHNVIDLSSDVYSIDKIDAYLKQTRTYILPLAQQINQKNMFRELNDLLEKRQALCR